MSLNKYGKDKWEDISGWTSVMIEAKIREIKNKKEQVYKEYIDRCDFLNEQIEYLRNALLLREDY